MRCIEATICVALLVCIICAILLVRSQVCTMEAFSDRSCSLTSEEFDTLKQLASDIKQLMLDIADFPWRQRDMYKIMYTLLVTRVNYLLNTFGPRLTVYEFAHMHYDKLIETTLTQLSMEYPAIISDVLQKYFEFANLLQTKSSTSCPVCDPLYIRQEMERIDHEFFLYIASLFSSSEINEHITEAVKKTIMKIEVDMLSITDLVDQAIAKQHANARGNIDLAEADKKLEEITVSYFAIVADIKLFQTLGKSLEDIMTFIEMKKVLINDLKQCIVMPLVFRACEYEGASIALRDGDYDGDKLKKNYNIEEIASIRVPPNYRIIIHVNNGDVFTYDSDVRCLPMAVRGAITLLSVVRRRESTRLSSLTKTR